MIDAEAASKQGGGPRTPLMLGLLGLGLIADAVMSGGWLLWIVWPGANFLALGLAHRHQFHRLFGKQATGSLAPVMSVCFAPLHALGWTCWHAVRICSREPATHVVSADLVVGRRLLSHELEPGFANLIDLTAEFAEPRLLRAHPGYRCFPILDGSAPDVPELRRLMASLAPGRTFVHCAQGHGRSGLVAIVLLLERGTAATVSEAYALLRRIRPGIRLNAVQLRCAQDYVHSRSNQGHS